MHYATRMCRLQRFKNFDSKVCCQSQCHGAICDDTTKGFAIEILHRNEGPPIGKLVEVENIDDALVTNLIYKLGLGKEALHQLIIISSLS